MFIYYDLDNEVFGPAFRQYHYYYYYYYYHGSQFFNRNYCVVPRLNGPNSTGLTLPLSDFLSVEGFYLTIFEHRTHLGKPLPKPSASNHNFLSNSSLGAWQSRWCLNSVTNLVKFFTVWILRKRVWSLNLPPSLAAAALIVEPNAHGLHDLEV